MGKYSEDKGLEVRVNLIKTQIFVHNVMNMRSRQDSPFDRPNLFPDANVPGGVKPGSREHAFLLFYSCSIDSMTSANSVYRNIQRLSEKVNLSELFMVPEKPLREMLLEVGVNIGIGDPVKTLYENSRRIHNFYLGDPRQIYGSSFFGLPENEEIEKVFRALGEFEQFRDYDHFKMGVGKAALFMKNMVRFKMWPFDETKIPVKVDRHLNRMAIPNLVDFYLEGNLVKPAEVGKVRAETLIPLLTKAFSDLTYTKGISAVDLDDSLWAIGAYLCHDNLHYTCKHACPIQCSYRPKSDPTSTVFHPGTDNRKLHRGKQIIAGEGQMKLFD